MVLSRSETPIRNWDSQDMNGLRVDGERVIETAYKETVSGYGIYVTHAASYRFAGKFANGKKVLDFGCGSGYGSEIISRSAASITAVDVSQDAIEYAKHHHQQSNITFSLVQPGRLPFADESFDVVLSVQVIEHVEDDATYVREALRVLRHSGLFIIFTPNRRSRLFPFQRPWNRWHVREYDAEGLAELFRTGDCRVQVRYLSAVGSLRSITLARFMRTKWLTLPFTLSWWPNAWRLSALNFLHRFPRLKEAKGGRSPKFSESDVVINDIAEGAFDLIALVRKGT